MHQIGYVGRTTQPNSIDAAFSYARFGAPLNLLGERSDCVFPDEVPAAFSDKFNCPIRIVIDLSPDRRSIREKNFVSKWPVIFVVVFQSFIETESLEAMRRCSLSVEPPQDL